MADIADRIANLPEDRRRLLAALRRAGRTNETITRRDRNGEPAPLSFAQRRLWFVHQMGGGHVAYSAPVVHRIRGPLDLDALAGSLRRVLVRHESLRTVFPERDGEPAQVVRELTGPVLRTLSVEHLPPAERERAAAGLLLDEVHTPFDLIAGPVMRSTAIRLGEHDHIVVLNIHHITSDQWSMGILVRELAECYDALRAGREPALAELPVSYADYAVWQREQMTGAALDERLAFWSDRLAGLSELDIPADRPRPPAPSNRGAETALWLPPAMVPGLRELGESFGTSPFMTLLAAFAGLVSRYTGEPDVAVGTTSAGRETDQVAGLVGFFVNTVVLRTDLSGDPTFAELLARVRDSVLAAQRYGDLPFDLLVEHLRPVRDPSRPPLVSVMFQQDNTPDCALRLTGLDVELVDDFDPGTAKYDLLVSVRVWDDAARVHVQYSTDLFDRETVDRLLGGFRTLLGAALAEPHTPLCRLPLLDEQQRQQILVAWNDTDVSWGEDRCLHELFAAQAAERPEATAAVARGVRHTFAELEAESNRLAHHLVASGVRPGERVAVFLRPGVDHLRAVLATMKAGGAFVPVDPDYPAARVAFLLEDSSASAVVTSSALASRLEPVAGRTVVRVDGPVEGFPDSGPDVAVRPDDPCYVIYTSGSTGTPKGVVLRHRGVVNNLADLNARFGVGPGDSVLALSSPSFDMSVYELLGVPGAGGTVVFPEPELLREPAHWADLIAEHGVTVWNSAPALLELLLDHVEQSVDDRPETLRLALLGGDWVPVSMPDRLRALAPGLEFVSLGGATEASIHSIIYPVGAVDPGWTSIPYGTPMANQQAYLLDDALEPVPVGVPGELHLAGVGLAQGYLNQPELTAQKFVTWQGKRLYRTGDLAKWRPDGVIELLGRKDFMVKINGLRIELGEIETTLRDHPHIGDAVVTTHTDPAGDQQLVGYLVAEPGIDLSAVRHHLEDRLPTYLVPPRLLVIDEIPLTPNGKVNRAALAGYSAGDFVSTVDEPPVGPLEERVAAAFREVLGVPKVNRDDDFFASGGDSFKAVRAARLIDSRLPVIAVFRNPTVASLAESLAGGEQGGHALVHRLTPERDQVTTNVVCVPYGGGNAVAYQPLADALGAEHALWSVDLPGHDLADPRPLEPIEDVAVRCAEEIRDRVTGPVALYGQCAGTAATLLLARRLEDLGVPVVATFMGAALPDPEPERSWQMVVDGSDEQLFEHMRRLGGFDGALSDEDVAGILRVVRHDLVEMVRLYLAEAGSAPRRLAGPVHCVVGDDDPATDGYAERYREWASYGATATLSVVPGGGHYFCKHQPAAVAAIIAEKLS